MRSSPCLRFNLGPIGQLAGVIGFVLLTRARPVRGLPRAPLPADPHDLSRRALSSDRLGLALCAARLLWWIAIIADARARLSVRAGQSRTLQDAQHLARQSARAASKARAPRLFLRGLLLWLLIAGPLIAALVAMAATFDPALIDELKRSGAEAAFKQFSIHASGFRGCDWRSCCGDRLGAPRRAAALSGLPRDGAALVGFGFAFRRCRRVVAPAHRSGLRRLSALHRLVDGLGHDRRHHDRAGRRPGAIGDRPARSEQPGDRGRWSCARGLCHRHARLFGHLSGQGQAGLVADRSWSSSDLSNPATLERVSSVGAPASPVGEGLADALNVGGF